MATPDPPGRPAPDPEPASAAVPESAPAVVAESAPAVVAVVVTDGGPDLDRCLGALAAQDYPALTILVLDRGTAPGRTERRERVALAAPSALVRALDRHARPAPGDAVRAANDVIATVEGAPFLCFVADDVELEPHAVSQLAEEAFRSNAAICGPKIVDRDHPERLLEVGMATDHYGVAMTGIEPGEVDQEQHDAVRDVFFVSRTVMFVRADLFRELGGFDPECAPGSEDLDLCWRARLAGARVMVVPDARARRSALAARRADDTSASVRDATRTRARTLLKNYSGAALVWVLPVATFLVVVEAVAYLMTRRARLARATFGGWWSAVFSAGRTRDARRRAQSVRAIDDRDVRAYMVRGSARVRVLLMRRRHRASRGPGAPGTLRAIVARARAGARTPDVMIGVVFAIVLAVGARRFLFQAVPSVGGFQRWPGTTDLLGAWGGRWRFTGFGTDAAAPSSLGVFGASSAALLGHPALARAVIVFGALPCGLVGVYRLTRRLSSRALPASAALVAYGANPVVRNAYANARLGALVLFALAPFILQRVCIVAEGASGGPRRRAIAGTVVLAALSAAVAPASLLFPALAAAAVVLGTPLVGGIRAAGRAGALSFVVAAGAAVALWPWSATAFGGSGASFGFATRPPLGFVDVVAFRTGPAGAGPWPFLLYAGAALPLLVATEERFAWAVRAWLLAAASLALTFVPSWIASDTAVPEPEVLLVPAALGLALAAGIGIGAFIEEIRTFVFGLRQGVAVLLASCAALPAVGALPDVFDGGYDAPRSSWAASMAFLDRQGAADGAFRILWVGAPDVLPVDAVARSGAEGFAVTRNGAGDVRDLLPAEPGRADAIVARALELARSGRTTRFGHVLAPLGIRYVALVDRPAPDSTHRIGFGPVLTPAFDSQLDLELSRRGDGLALYENEAWMSSRALYTDELAASARGTDVSIDDAIVGATRSEFAEHAQPLRGALSELAVPQPGVVLFGESYDADWQMTLDGGDVAEHDATFGWANGFVVPKSGVAKVAFSSGGMHLFSVVAPLLFVAALLVLAMYRPRGEATARALAFESTLPVRGRRPRVARVGGPGQPGMGEPESGDETASPDDWDEISALVIADARPNRGAGDPAGTKWADDGWPEVDWPEVDWSGLAADDAPPTEGTPAEGSPTEASDS